MRNVDLMVKEARTMFRTLGPKVVLPGDEADALKVRRCRTCDPDPETYRCPICGRENLDEWRHRLHIRIYPETCQREGKRKQRAWADKV